MKVSNKIIFILGIAKFDGAFESTSYTVAKFLAEDNKVYYIDYPYTWKDYFSKRDESFARRKAAFSRKSNGILGTNLPNLKIVIVPPLLSINFLREGAIYRWFLKINEDIIVRRIRKIITQFKIKDFIFINSFNFHYPEVGIKLNAKLYVYHCVDPLIVDHDVKHGLISERKIVESCDLVICTSRQLYREKQVANPNTYFIPNAADISHSSKAREEDLPIHRLLLDISKPVIGYFGNIERRIDYQLLEKVIQSLPSCSFVFAGPVDEQWVPHNFRSLPNVHFIGRVPYTDMPAVLKGFDVAMIPFKKDEVSRTIFPLKLFEYLGTGKPVVATDFNPDLQEFTGDTIKYCTNDLEFTLQIQEAIQYDDMERQAKRIMIASENSWLKRLTELSELMAAYFSKR